MIIPIRRGTAKRLDAEVWGAIALAFVALGVVPIYVAGSTDSVAWQWVWASVALLLEIVGAVLVVAAGRMARKEDAP